MLSCEYDIFLSYRTSDVSSVRELTGLLVSFGGLKVWLDEWELAPGASWRAETESAMWKSAAIGICVGKGKGSTRQSQEIHRILEVRRMRPEVAIIPILLPGGDFGSVPPEFKDLACADFRDGFGEEKRLERLALAVSNLSGGLRPKVNAATVLKQNLPAIWNVPYMRNPHFTGRDAMLDELHAKLKEDRVALTAVRGMGGVGKTQLALEYAYQHSGDFDIVWWLRAEEPSTLLSDYVALAHSLGLAQSDETDIVAGVAAVRQELTRRNNWLLVFDNANQPDEIEHLLPKADGGRVLITSRNPSWPFASALDVPTLSRHAAVQFLQERTGQQDGSAADALVH